SDQVLTAMARGIESLLLNQGNRNDRPETVKPGITELPPLPLYTPETGSIDLINWVTHITPIMEDLSDSSSVWWTETLQDVMSWYARYSVATPLERVQLLPIRATISKPEWARVERRATAMMLTAIPQSIKEEVIAVGGVTTVNLMAKLFSTYQPGNRQEKALVLANLEKPGETSDAKGAVEALRKWALWRRRAMAIGITEPDASVLLQGLDRICGSVVKADSELAFRVSLIRSTLQVDTCPTSDSVTRFFQHLQAELEQQARLGAVRGTELNPRLKALGSTAEFVPPPAPPAPTRGKECRYPHTWSSFEKAERAKRCLVCGGTGHKSKECKAPGGGANGKPKDGLQAGPKEASATPSSAPPSGHASPSRKVAFDGTPDIAMKVFSVLEDVKKVKAFAPLVEAVDRWSQRWTAPAMRRTALMDSGATHPLRPPRDEQEWLEAMNVKVALAGDARTTMRQTASGTLLSGDELSQVIVPLGRVINSLGYRLQWTATECALLRGDEEVIPLRVVRGCPEVDELVAKKLIQELEQTQVPRLQEATMESVKILKDVEVSWWSCLVEYVTSGDVQVAYLNVGALLALGNFMDVWRVLLWAATQGRIGAILSKDLGDTLAEHEAHKKHRSQVHLLHALAAAGKYHMGSVVPRFLVERRRGSTWDSVDWMCDGKAQRYCDEMCSPDPMFFEQEAVEIVNGLTGTINRSVVIAHYACATSPDGKYFKYFLVGAFRIPLLDGGVTYDEDFRGHPIPEEFEPEDAPVLSDDDQVDVHLEEEEEMAPAAEENRDQEEWKRLKEKFKAPLMTQTLYFCIPMNSKKSMHILPALQQMVVDIRGLGYPVTRIHSDRGGELRSNASKRWVLNQGIMRTTSTGSEPAENGVAEAGVRYLKRRGRVLLDAAGLGREHWPTAIQTAALQQRCDKLAIPSAMPVAYGAKVYVKTKKYKTGDVESMKPHWMQGKYLGPSTDVRGGHVILKSVGTFLTTTHVRVAREPPKLDDVAPTIVVDPEEPPLPPREEEPLEHPGDRPRVEAASSSGLGRGRSLGPKNAMPVEHPGDRHRVEAASSSGLGRILDDGTESIPPYPKGPPISYSPPVSRVRGKSPGIRMSTMRAGDYEDMVEAMEQSWDHSGEASYSQEEVMIRVLKAQERQAVEAVARELLNAGDFSKQACQRLLRALGGFHTRWRTPRTTEGQGMVLGAYVRGGSFGVTNHGRSLPFTMRFLNKFMLIRLQYTMPGSTSTWTTLALQRASEIPAHRDVHNQRGTRNYVMEIADESLEGLWIEGDEESHPVEGGDGVCCAHEYQTEDGQVLQGRVHSLDEPVAFDPRSRHAMVNAHGMKWVLSAYTPSGVQALLQADVDYLFSHGFPVTGTGVSLPTVRAIQRVSYGPSTTWETTPTAGSSSFGPEFVPQSGTRGAWAEEEEYAGDGCEEEQEDENEASGDWELFVEDSEESCVMQQDSEPEDEPLPRLRVLCSSSDPGPERELLVRRYEGYLEDVNGEHQVQEEMTANLEEWEVVWPRIAKVEPEFTENIEALIDGLQEPLRHTHNVSPHEVRAAVEKWRSAIVKELGVVEKGFYRTTVDGVRSLKRTRRVQELPAKMVYTMKPPTEPGEPGTEAFKCKRKARIVCCGNFNSEDPGDVSASRAAAESLRCVLTLTAMRRWSAGGLDIGGAFMLTPLDDGEGAVLFAVTPPAILARLGLVAPDERWILTHAMYGLRQSPKLWSVFRDKTVKAMKIELDGELWQFRQGVAEPNLWYLFKLDDATTTGPEAVLLIYVDDLLICGPDRLVKAIATSVSTTWKTSDLDVVEPNHGIRFLGCEIEVNEAKDTYWIHQKPYVMELIRQHQVPETARSPIPCPREMLTLAVSDDEPKGDEGDLRRAQRLCGELLWLSQRSRPDISFPVSIMGSLLTKAAPRSIQIGTRLLSYLQRTMGVALEIKPSSGGFEAWSDCSYAPSGCRSHSGMAITWNKAVIGWRSGRQPFTCLSTAEGELVAAIETLVLAMSLKAIVDEFGVSIADMTLCIDNRAALSLATPGTSASWSGFGGGDNAATCGEVNGDDDYDGAVCEGFFGVDKGYFVGCYVIEFDYHKGSTEYCIGVGFLAFKYRGIWSTGPEYVNGSMWTEKCQYLQLNRMAGRGGVMKGNARQPFMIARGS
ncbi:unnamed protein product, partial [Symbiodinium microadriaticum]